MTDNPTTVTPRRAPRIRIESDGTAGYKPTRVLVDGLDMASFLRSVTWRLGVDGGFYATADVELVPGAELAAAAAPTAEAMRQLEKVNSLKLRSQAMWLTRDGQFRTVVTDTESASGVMLRCASPEHPEEDRDRQWDVEDCCGTDVVEMYHEVAAAFYVEALAAVPALLDERRQLRARIAELEARAAPAELNGHPRCCTCGKNLGYRNHRSQLFCWPCADGEGPEAHAVLECATTEPDPQREQLVHDDPALADQICEGIAEAEAGQTVYLGTFAEHLDDNGGDR